MSESVAQDQIRAFVERIMRLREEAKEINRDIREIYAEAKGNGFDKTVLGKLVLHVERQADAGKAMAAAEQDALLDLYIEAYYGKRPSHTHAHAREERGEIAGNGAGGAEDQVQVATVRASSSAQPNPEAKATKAKPSQAQGASADGVASRASVGAGSDASITVPRHEVEEADEGEVTPPTSSADIPEPAEAATPASAGHGDRGAVVPSAAPVVAEPNDYTKPNPWCLDQEECGLSSWDHFCLRCQRVKAERQAVEAVQ